jgi:hypothetical protein
MGRSGFDRTATQNYEQTQIFGDLISYQNDGECSTAIVGKIKIA